MSPIVKSAIDNSPKSGDKEITFRNDKAFKFGAGIDKDLGKMGVNINIGYGNYEKIIMSTDKLNKIGAKDRPAAGAERLEVISGDDYKEHLEITGGDVRGGATSLTGAASLTRVETGTQTGAGAEEEESS